MTELNAKEKETLRVYERFEEEIYNKGNLDAIDELVTKDFRHHAPFPTPQGREGYRQFMTQFTEAIPDNTSTTEDVVVQGDKIAVRYTARGTHKGELAGVPASGEPVEVQGISIYRIVDGKVAAEWSSPDMLGFMQQAGALPSPE